MATETMVQSWHTCKHGFYSDGGDEMSYELKSHGIYESYNCENENVIELGIYPQNEILEKDKSIKKVALLSHILIADELSQEEAKKLEEIIERRLICCKHCKFYDPSNL